MAGKLGALASDSEDRPASKLRWSTSASDLVCAAFLGRAWQASVWQAGRTILNCGMEESRGTMRDGRLWVRGPTLSKRGASQRLQGKSEEVAMRSHRAMPTSCNYCVCCQLKSCIWRMLLYRFFGARAPDAGFARHALHQNIASSFSAADLIGFRWLGLAAG